MTDFEINIVNRLEQLIFEGKINQECQFKIFNLMCEYLNLKSISHEAKEKGITPQAVYKRRNIIEKFGIKLSYE